MKYALDTNIVFRYLKNESPCVQSIDGALAESHMLYIPIIVDYEVRRGFKLMQQPSHRKEYVYNLLTLRSPVVDMNSIIWERASDVYKVRFNYHNIRRNGNVDFGRKKSNCHRRPRRRSGSGY